MLNSYQQTLLEKNENSALGKLEFRWGYYNEPEYRTELNAFAFEMFPGLDFSRWNNLGYRFAEYTPFSFFKEGKVIANVSASPMKLVISGEATEAVQIGTVATLPALREQGLIRALMEKAHAHWDKSHKLYFLFTNSSAVNFYQQFGYRRVPEYSFSAAAPAFKPAPEKARKLDLANPADRELLYRLSATRAPASQKIGVYRHTWLLLFHASTVYPERLLYIEPLDIVVISESDKNTLRLIDVIGKKIPPLSEIYPFIGAENINRVEFSFTPDLMQAGDIQAQENPESLLFIRGDFKIENEPLLFPETGKA